MAVGTLSCALISTGLVIVFPKVTQIIMDDVRMGRADRIAPLALLAAFTYFIRDILNGARILLNNTFEQQVIFDLRSDLYSHIQRLPLRWFDDRATGDIMTRVLEDVNAVERVLIDGIEQGASSILQILVVLIALFFVDVRLALLAMTPIPFLVAGALTYTITAPTRYRKQRAAASAMNARLHDNLAGIRQIKAYVREDEEHERFNAMSDRHRQATLGVMRAWALYHPSMNFFGALGAVMVIGFGGQAVIEGRMTMGDLAGFLWLVGALYEPVGRLHSLNQLIQSGRAAGERVFEIMDEPEESPDNVPAAVREERAPATIRGEVVFRDVEFSYSEDVPVIRHVSLHALSGQTIALVGPTGAGKSTLVQMLTRFYEYDSGEIIIDGVPLRDYPRGVLRSAIGMVTQESFLFNGTVRENLLLGRSDATDEELKEALITANAWEFVERLEKRLDTIVGERGVKLSVGEKQRISIARALLKNPPILILDEATASVDTHTERLIQEALSRLLKSRTSFVIAHRLSTIREADQILVLDRGRIVERGTHASLLELDGLYAKLHKQALHGEKSEDTTPALEK